MLTIRIPTVKYLAEVVTQLQDCDCDVNITIDRWSDELDMAESTPPTGLLDQLKRSGAMPNNVASTQMTQLRNHLRGE